MVMTKMISDSEFYMWRAVFAFSFADGVLSVEEQDILSQHIARVPFSKRQMEILHEDFKEPKDAEEMYKGIIDDQDKERFCSLARALAWCEGDMDAQEKLILRRLDCLNTPEGFQLLQKTRNPAAIQTYRDQYKRYGLGGWIDQDYYLKMVV